MPHVPAWLQIVATSLWARRDYLASPLVEAIGGETQDCILAFQVFGGLRLVLVLACSCCFVGGLVTGLCLCGCRRAYGGFGPAAGGRRVRVPVLGARRGLTEAPRSHGVPDRGIRRGGRLRGRQAPAGEEVLVLPHARRGRLPALAGVAAVVRPSGGRSDGPPRRLDVDGGSSFRGRSAVLRTSVGGERPASTPSVVTSVGKRVLRRLPSAGAEGPALACAA